MHRFHIIAAFAVGAALAIAARTVDAQAGLREGLKIRLSLDAGPRVTGVMQSLTPDSIFLFIDPAATRVGIARQSIRAIEVSHGRSSSQGAKKGALWGGGVMGGIGAISAIGFVSSDRDAHRGGAGAAVVLVTMILAAEGAGIGAIVGALVKSERWESVSVAPVVGTGATGFRVGVRIR